MTEQITLKKALELVDFRQDSKGEWYVGVVRGDCDVVAGNCDTVKGYCRIVEGYCATVEGNCGSVEGDCYLVKGNCNFVDGEVFGAINGREWQYVETPREKLQRLIEKGAGKEQLIEAFNQLEDN